MEAADQHDRGGNNDDDDDDQQYYAAGERSLALARWHFGWNAVDTRKRGEGRDSREYLLA